MATQFNSCCWVETFLKNLTPYHNGNLINAWRSGQFHAFLLYVDSNWVSKESLNINVTIFINRMIIITIWKNNKYVNTKILDTVWSKIRDS